MSLSCSLSSTDYPISRAAKSQVLTSPNLLYSVPSPSLLSSSSLSSPTCSPQPLGWHLRLPPGSHLLTPLGCQASFCTSNTRGTFLPQGLWTCHFPLSAIPFSRYPHNPPSCFLQVSTQTSPHQRTFLSHTQRKEQNHLRTTEGPLFSLSGPDTA